MKKILIANRGEIAVRISRACREMGLSPVAVSNSVHDRTALHVRLADEAYAIGGSAPRDSLPSHRSHRRRGEGGRRRAACILRATGFLPGSRGVRPRRAGRGSHVHRSDARSHRADGKQGRGSPAARGDAPAYRWCRARPIRPRDATPTYLQPSRGSADIRARESRVRRRQRGRTDVQSRGILAAPCGRAIGSRAAFGRRRGVSGRRLSRPRHIGESSCSPTSTARSCVCRTRKCSIQRRHQKVVEETPSVAVTPELRHALAAAAAAVARAAGSHQRGTIEVPPRRGRAFCFLEMNTRLQGQHAITETVTGLGSGAVADPHRTRRPVRPRSAALIAPKGRAIECRIYAEDPTTASCRRPAGFSTPAHAGPAGKHPR